MCMNASCISAVVGFLVGGGFEKIHNAAATDVKISLLCCSVMDDLLLCEFLSQTDLWRSLRIIENETFNTFNL